MEEKQQQWYVCCILLVTICMTLVRLSWRLREGLYLARICVYRWTNIVSDRYVLRRSFPERVDDLNKDWFTKVLGKRVRTIERNRKKENLPLDKVGAGGAGTSRCWIRIEFEDGSSEHLFIKLPATTMLERLFLTVFGVYENEIRFYKSVRDTLPNDLTAEPRYADWQSTKFVLVLRDLSIERDVIFPTILDPYPIDRVRLVLRSLARFHAANWNRVPLGCWTDEWSASRTVPSSISIGRTRPPFLKIIATSTLTKALERYPSALDPSIVSAYRKFIANYPAVRKFWSTGDLTMCHGDCHIGNMGFRKDDRSMFFFDMQCVAAEHPMRDVSYHLLSCFNDGDLADVEDELLSYYLHHLNERIGDGENGLGFEEAVFHYRIQSFWVLTAFVISAGASELMDESVGRVILPRLSRHMCRIEANAALSMVLGDFSAFGST